MCQEFMDEIDALKDSIEVENGSTKILTICSIQLYLSSNFNLSCFCFVDDVIGATEEVDEAILDINWILGYGYCLLCLCV